MRVVFSSTPAFGHVLPLLPLALAARDAGAEVAVVTAAMFAESVAPLELMPAGPAFAEINAEYERRTGVTNIVELDAEAFGELFGAVRIDLTFDAALIAARQFGAELIVAEREDMVGPMVAAALGVPWVRYLLGADLPPEITVAIHARAAAEHRKRGLLPAPPAAVVDPWPKFMQPADWQPEPLRIIIRPEPHTGQRSARSTWRPKSSGRRPRVLVTPGTIAHDSEKVAAMMASLAGVDVDVVLTGRYGEPWPIDVDPQQVEQVGFVPLAELLNGVYAVVLAGGSGTVAAALSQGLPMVVSPMVFDQFPNAERVAATGAAIIATSPDQVGSKVRQILADPSVRNAARSFAAQIASMDSPATAWKHVRNLTS